MTDLDRFGRYLELEGRRRARYYRRLARLYGRISLVALVASLLSFALAVRELLR